MLMATAKTKTSIRKKPRPLKRAPITINEPIEPVTSANRKNRLLWIVPIFVFAVVLIGLGVWKYLDQQKQIKALKDPKQASLAATEQLIKDVNKAAVMPKDEQPIIREISELKSLASQPFYYDAQIGDRVLVFSKAKKAILYRPSTGQVVNITNNIVVQPTDQTQTAPVQSPN